MLLCTDHGPAGSTTAVAPPPPPLMRAQLRFNTVHEGTRNRVENVIRKVKGHKLFSGRTFTGKYETLEAALHVIGHVAAYQLRQYQRYHVWPVATCLWAGRAAKPTLEGVVITCYHFSDTLEAASCCQFLPVSASCCQFSADSFQFPQWPFLFPVALEKSAHYSYHSTHLGPK